MARETLFAVCYPVQTRGFLGGICGFLGSAVCLNGLNFFERVFQPRSLKLGRIEVILQLCIERRNAGIIWRGSWFPGIFQAGSLNGGLNLGNAQALKGVRVVVP